MARAAKVTEAAAHVALLRGVNVGGKNLLPMKELGPLFQDLGCLAVKTYIQSGNVVFRASDEVAAKVGELAAQRIEKQFGFKVPVLVRSQAELAEVIANNPFLAAGAPVELLHVVFLLKQPTKAQLSSLDPQRSPPDLFAARGREVYLNLPNGAGKTKLSNAWFDSKLGTVSSGRNWRTVLKLQELMGTI